VGRHSLAILVSLLAPLPMHAADEGYLGSQACAGCHQQIYQRYQGVAMAHSMSPANAATPLAGEAITVSSPKLNRSFQVYREGSDVYQSESEIGAGGETAFKVAFKLEFAVGSGVNGFSYAVRRGDYLFEAPLSYYSRTKKWDVSPGYEFVDSGFNRPLAAACLACHSGRARPVRDRTGLYLDPPFEELPIGCENCHGPGRAHVATRGSPKSIVNPARLAPRLAEQICMNCHQRGDARVLQPRKDYSDFRPGAWLNETLAIFKIPSKINDEDLLEHHSAMESSKCFIGSNGKLSCFTCHDPHSRPSRAEAAAWYRDKCLTCHSEASCKLPLSKRAERSNDCAGCHMPKRDVTVISHSALTNHRIIAYAGEPLPANAAQAEGGLIHVNRPPGSGKFPRLTLWQAYGELMDKDPAFQARYLALLDELAKDERDNGLVQAALGARDSRRDSNAAAIAHLRKALDLGFSSSTLYADLAEALARAGQLEEAVAVLKRGIQMEPYAPSLYKSLALRYIMLKQYPRAKETLELHIELFPEDDFVRGLLTQVERHATR
jgi:tetratricopeptide (TPR) repeat protein